MRRHTLFLVAAAAAPLSLLTPQALAGKKKIEASSPLVPTASGPLNASGEIDLRLKGARVDLKIEVEDLPAGAYDVFIGGVNRGSLTVVATIDGLDGEIEYRNRPSNDKVFLDFDPAGLAVEIQQNGTALLAGVVPDIDINDPAAAALSDFPSQKVEVEMVNTGVAPEAEAELRFRSKKNKADFELRVKDLPAGTYELIVNDVVVASVVYDGKGKEKLRFSTKPRGDRLALDFDPANATVRLAKDDVDFFTATLVAEDLPDLDGAGEVEIDLSSTGVQAGAKGKAKFEDKDDRDDFSVEIEDVAAGAYDLLVDGVKVATIVAAPTSDGVEGKVEFRSLPNDDPEKLDLTFDPRGKLIQIVLNGEVILGGVLPAD